MPRDTNDTRDAACCDVCFDSYSGECYALPCGHVFHRPCIEGIIKAARTTSDEELLRGVRSKQYCPLDRKSFAGFGRADGPIRIYVDFANLAHDTSPPSSSASGSGAGAGAGSSEPAADTVRQQALLAQAQARITQLQSDLSREQGRAGELSVQVDTFKKDASSLRTTSSRQAIQLKEAVDKAAHWQKQAKALTAEVDGLKKKLAALGYQQHEDLDKLQADLLAAALDMARRQAQAAGADPRSIDAAHELTAAELATMCAAVQLRIRELDKAVGQYRKSCRAKDEDIARLNGEVQSHAQLHRLLAEANTDNKALHESMKAIRRDNDALRAELRHLKGGGAGKASKRPAGGKAAAPSAAVSRSILQMGVTRADGHGAAGAGHAAGSSAATSASAADEDDGGDAESVVLGRPTASARGPRPALHMATDTDIDAMFGDDDDGDENGDDVEQEDDSDEGHDGVENGAGAGGASYGFDGQEEDADGHDNDENGATHDSDDEPEAVGGRKGSGTARGAADQGSFRQPDPASILAAGASALRQQQSYGMSASRPKLGLLGQAESGASASVSSSQAAASLQQALGPALQQAQQQVSSWGSLGGLKAEASLTDLASSGLGAKRPRQDSGPSHPSKAAKVGPNGKAKGKAAGSSSSIMLAFGRMATGGAAEGAGAASSSGAGSSVVRRPQTGLGSMPPPPLPLRAVPGAGSSSAAGQAGRPPLAALSQPVAASSRACSASGSGLPVSQAASRSGIGLQVPHASGQAGDLDGTADPGQGDPGDEGQDGEEDDDDVVLIE